MKLPFLLLAAGALVLLSGRQTASAQSPISAPSAPTPTPDYSPAAVGLRAASWQAAAQYQVPPGYPPWYVGIPVQDYLNAIVSQGLQPTSTMMEGWRSSESAALLQGNWKTFVAQATGGIYG